MKYILMDIEGTTTSISFVHDVLFPYSKERINSFINDNANNEVVKKALSETESSNTTELIAKLIEWIDEDIKHPVLKNIQGLIWKAGYQNGELKGHIYPEVAECLKNWSDAGIMLGIYSSGSIEAQQLLFGHSIAGDLNFYFKNNFDTSIGHKREENSYRNIAESLKLNPNDILFLSDIGQELDAAEAVGFQTKQLVRLENVSYTGHEQVKSFLEIKF